MPYRVIPNVALSLFWLFLFSTVNQQVLPYLEYFYFRNALYKFHTLPNWDGDEQDHKKMVYNNVMQVHANSDKTGCVYKLWCGVSVDCL